MRIMNRLVATEGRDKGGKLVLITSHLNAGTRTKGGKTRHANLDSSLPVMTGLFPLVCLLVLSFIPSFVRRSVFAKMSYASSGVALARSFPRRRMIFFRAELVSLIFGFSSRKDEREKTQTRKEEVCLDWT